jgi:hypothetical protein
MKASTNEVVLLIKERARLDYVVQHKPEFEDRYMRVYLTSGSSPDGVSGYFITRHSDPRRCIDMALDEEYIRIS